MDLQFALRTARIVLAAAALAALLPRFAPAQGTLYPLGVGARVRVSAPTLGPVPRVARVVEERRDSLIVRTEDAQHLMAAMPYSDITRIDVSRGKKRSSMRRWAGIGFIAGGTLGAMMFPPDKGSHGSVPFEDFSQLGNVIMLAGVGAGIGALVAHGQQQEQWQYMPLTERRVGFVMSHRGRGAGVGASLAF